VLLGEPDAELWGKIKLCNTHCSPTPPHRACQRELGRVSWASSPALIQIGKETSRNAGHSWHREEVLYTWLLLSSLLVAVTEANFHISMNAFYSKDEIYLSLQAWSWENESKLSGLPMNQSSWEPSVYCHSTRGPAQSLHLTLPVTLPERVMTAPQGLPLEFPFSECFCLAHFPPVTVDTL
jgi:hypothetical protein